MRNNKFIVIIILAVIFGFLSGIVGELIARVYIFENNFNIPYFGEINLSEDYNGGSNIIIRDAKKIVIEQDTKIKEAVAAASASMVGLYKKIATSTIKTGADSEGKSRLINIDKSYEPNDKLAAGFIITSDGWIICDYVPAGLTTSRAEKVNKTDTINKKIYNNYVFIANNKKIYSVDNVIIDNLTGYAFWHVDAVDLPVRQFASPSDIYNGRSVIAVNFQNWVLATTIIGQTYNGGGLVRSSDMLKHKLVLADELGKNFSGSFLFTIKGDLAALINKDNNVYAITNFLKSISSLLKNKTINRVSLGVNYIDLEELTMPGDESGSLGALIYKNEKGIAVAAGSPAEKAGLSAGDIIISVDNIELDKNNNLTDLISKYSPGDEITVVYKRGETKKEVKIKLGNLEQN